MLGTGREKAILPHAIKADCHGWPKSGSTIGLRTSVLRRGLVSSRILHATAAADMDHASVVITCLACRIRNGSFDPFGTTGGKCLERSSLRIRTVYKPQSRIRG